MRIHCLSSITLEVGNVGGKSEEEIAKEKNDAKMYALTIIEIGYSDIGRRNKEGEWCIEPSYKFLFIRDPSSDRDDLFDTILMTPGAMKIKDIDWKNFIIDIEFRQDKLKKSVLWMKSMRICNIKQVSTSTITKEERQKYRDYIECVNNYQLKNPGSTSEDAFDEIKMEKSVVEKTIKQTMRCIRDAITHLCDPENGSYKNIPTNARYKTKLQTFEETNREVTIQNQKEYARKKVDYKRNWHALAFISIKMPKFDDEWFEATFLTQLHLSKVEISDKSFEAWKKFADGIEQLNNLQFFRFEESNLAEIPKYFFQKLPTSLIWICLSGNNLKSIPTEISRLASLLTLILNNNPFLDDGGIPWLYLPTSIKSLDLSYSGITVVPETIQRLISLKELLLVGTKINGLSWNSFPKNMNTLKIENLKDLDEINDLCSLSNLEISNAHYKVIRIDHFPRRISTLNIQNAQLESFALHSEYIFLRNLNLANNKLKYFPWEDIPRNLIELNLSHNQIEYIDPISTWRNLDKLDLSYNRIQSFNCPKENVLNNTARQLQLNLSNNQLSSLPYNFENLSQIKALKVDNNNFKDPDLSEKLWERLPTKCLESLHIVNNDIRFLPCILKRIHLLFIKAQDCNLQYICPQLSRNYSHKIFHLDLRNNPALKNLPFIPKDVLSLPDEDAKCREVKKDWKPEKENYILRNVMILSNNSFQCTDRSRTFQKRLYFDFKECSNDVYFCKCCANCGISTENALVEQLMTMDINLFEENNNDQFTFWEPGTWKTNVKTRLCDGCKEMYNKEAQTIVVSNKRKYIKKAKPPKRQKNDAEKSDAEMEEADSDLHALSEDNNPLVFKLKKLNAIDSFLIGVINSIDSMREFKEAVCKNLNNLELTKLQKELTTILQRNTNSIVSFRKAISLTAKNRMNEGCFVFEKVVQSFDEHSQSLLTFSYQIFETCLCGRKIINQKKDCIILNLNVNLEVLNQIYTFDSLLQNWKNNSTAYYCQMCNCEKIIEKQIQFGDSQQYLIVGLNDDSDAIPITSININNQLIFGNLWKLECLIQKTNVGKEGRYLTWKRADSKWIVNTPDRHWYEKQLLSDLNQYKIMIFKKLIVQFITENEILMEVENNEENVYSQNEAVLPPISTLLKKR